MGLARVLSTCSESRCERVYFRNLFYAEHVKIRQWQHLLDNILTSSSLQSIASHDGDDIYTSCRHNFVRIMHAEMKACKIQ